MTYAAAARERDERGVEVVQETLRQLGGQMFAVMTGAKGFTRSGNSLLFSLPGGAFSRGINKFRVELAASDTYTLTAYRLRRRGLEVEVLAEESGVYNENLRSTFERMTGLRVSL